jgi:hypothetical protein
MKLGWVRSHTARRTVATILDLQGLSARAIADQLGHARPPMTQDVYMGRRVVSGAASHLEGLAPLVQMPPETPHDARQCDHLCDHRSGNARGPDQHFCRSGPQSCTPSGTRTPNPLIKSQLLCQLS